MHVLPHPFRQPETPAAPRPRLRVLPSWELARRLANGEARRGLVEAAILAVVASGVAEDIAVLTFRWNGLALALSTERAGDDGLLIRVGIGPHAPRPRAVLARELDVAMKSARERDAAERVARRRSLRARTSAWRP